MLSSSESSQLKFLLIDDNKIIRKNFEQTFKIYNPNVDISICGSLDVADTRLRQGDKYHMIWVDYRLSDNDEINGADWIDQVARQYPSSLFVIYTSFGKDPILTEKVEQLYRKHKNFELFVEQKGNHDQLVAIYKAFVDQFFGVPPAFMRLIDKLEQEIRVSKNESYFREGKAYYEFQLGIMELREQLQETLGNNPNELLQAQLKRLNQDWCKLLREYYPKSPDRSNIWSRINYYQFFKAPEMRSYVEKVTLSAFRKIQTIFNIYKITGKESQQETEEKVNKQEQEVQFFQGIIQNLKEGEGLEVERLQSYLELRKQDRQQELSPDIIYELADQKQHLFKRVQADWKEHKQMKRIEKLLSPPNQRNVFESSLKTSDVSQIMEIVSEKLPTTTTPKWEWQKELGGNYICGFEEVLPLLPEECSVIFCDARTTRYIIQKVCKKYVNPFFDSLPSNLPERNFSSLVESLILGRNDSTSKFEQMPLLIVGYRDFLENILNLGRKWRLNEFVVENPRPIWEKLVLGRYLYFWELPKE
jgi:hypothetical protein